MCVYIHVCVFLFIYIYIYIVLKYCSRNATIGNTFAFVSYRSGAAGVNGLIPLTWVGWRVEVVAGNAGGQVGTTSRTAGLPGNHHHGGGAGRIYLPQALRNVYHSASAGPPLQNSLV